MAIFLQNAIFTDYILPFLLTFTLIFAILEKSKILGENKHQINAIIGFVLGAIVISFANVVDIIREMVIFMVLALIILFVFMIIYGFAAAKEKDLLELWMKRAIAIVAIIAVVIAILVITGYWDEALNFFKGDIGLNLIFGAIVIAAVAAVLFGAKGGESK